MSRIIQASLIDDPYYEYNVLLVWIANILIILAYIGGFCLALYALEWAISLENFLKALFLAYLLAWVWSKFGAHFTSFEQEMYLIDSTVGYTVITGATIQIHRMQWADGKALFVYWTLLLIIGFFMWLLTLNNVKRAPGVKPVLVSQQIAYKHKFFLTKIPKEIPPTHQAQAYLKKMKFSRQLL